MNPALIAIGICNTTQETRALAAAQRIGKVVINHGEANCKNPDAAEYLHKTAAHKKRLWRNSNIQIEVIRGRFTPLPPG